MSREFLASTVLGLGTVTTHQCRRTSSWERPNKDFPANGRLDILSPNQPIILAEENEIPLRVHGTGLVTLSSFQTQYHGRDLKAPDVVDGSEQTLQIQCHSDGNCYIAFVPLRLCKVELTLDGQFPDGGVVIQKIMLDVRPTQRRPEKLMVGHIGTLTFPKVLMYMNGAPRREMLNVSAMYDGIASPVRIDPSFATFRIIKVDSSIPIHLDEQTGLLTPIHPGQAVVETTFGGRTNLTCVDVEEVLVPGNSYFRKSCQQLLSPGEKLGPQE